MQRYFVMFLLATSIALNSTLKPINAQLNHFHVSRHRIDGRQKGKSPPAGLLEEIQQPKENVLRVLAWMRAGAKLEVHDVVAGVRYYTPLQYAAQLHHWKTVSVLVKQGANVNPVAPYGDEHYYTPLMHCATEGQLAAVKLLIQHGACVNAKGYHGLTALMLAARSGHREVVRTLLKSGADTRAITDLGHNNALTFAIYENHKDVAKLLRHPPAKNLMRNKPIRL